MFEIIAIESGNLVVFNNLIYFQRQYDRQQTNTVRPVVQQALNITSISFPLNAAKVTSRSLPNHHYQLIQK